MILLHSEYASIKGCKKKFKICLGRDTISLHTKKHVDNTKEDNTIWVDGRQITIKSSQTRDYQGIHIEKIISISICNDKIICNSSAIKNEQYKNYRKDVNEKIECTNKVRYIILNKIMHSLFKVCKE